MLFARQHNLPFSNVQPLTAGTSDQPSQVVVASRRPGQVAHGRQVGGIGVTSGENGFRPARLALTHAGQLREAVSERSGSPEGSPEGAPAGLAARAKRQRVDERQQTSLLRSAAATPPAPEQCAASACNGHVGAASKVLRLDTGVRRLDGARRSEGGTVLVAPQRLAELVTAAPVNVDAGAEPLSTRKRIEHAVEMFGACMLIVAALAITLFA